MWLKDAQTLCGIAGYTALIANGYEISLLAAFCGKQLPFEELYDWS